MSDGAARSSSEGVVMSEGAARSLLAGRILEDPIVSDIGLIYLGN